MKTKVLLIVLLVGMVCLGSSPSHRERMEMQKQRFEQDQILRSQRLERFAEKKQRKEDRVYRQRLLLLEARVAHLEHALTTKLSHTEVPSDLQEVFDAETIRRSNEGKAEVQRAVYSRVLEAVKSKPLSGEKSKR